MLTSELTQRLRIWSGDKTDEEANEVFRVVYDELRRQARRYLRNERVGHTLQTTALVNEAYLKLRDQKIVWQSRSQFFGIAATLMRRILIDHAKQKHRAKRGGANSDVPLDDAPEIAVSGLSVDLLALDAALDRLAAKDAQLASVVELRFFSGLDVPDTAEVLGVSESTVKRDWAMAKAWLHRELTR